MQTASSIGLYETNIITVRKIAMHLGLVNFYYMKQ
jgi:hypothetical protein